MAFKIENAVVMNYKSKAFRHLRINRSQDKKCYENTIICSVLSDIMFLFSHSKLQQNLQLLLCNCCFYLQFYLHFPICLYCVHSTLIGITCTVEW